MAIGRTHVYLVYCNSDIEPLTIEPQEVSQETSRGPSSDAQDLQLRHRPLQQLQHEEPPLPQAEEVAGAAAGKESSSPGSHHRGQNLPH